jgi:NADPH:quinone reductase-like Zn-dependent oxidoreductase
LGADEVIDYQTANFVDQIRKSHPGGIAVVFDTIGGAIYKKSFEVLKTHGRIVSILEQPDLALAEQFKVQAEYLFVSANGKQLQEIGHLFETGKVKAPKIQVFPLDQASQVIAEIRKGHTLGKMVISVQDVPRDV